MIQYKELGASVGTLLTNFRVFLWIFAVYRLFELP